MGNFFPEKGTCRKHDSIETESSWSKTASPLNPYFNKLLFIEDALFINKMHAVKKTSETKPSSDDHDSPSEIKYSSK